MSRPLLTLYALERPALKALAAELKDVLARNQSAPLAELLELGEAACTQLEGFERIVDPFLLPDQDERARVLWASVRRISKKRALSKVMTSDNAALEGRLRAYEPLRDNKQAAALIDKLINPRRLPWFLRRADATCGWLDGSERAQLADQLRALSPVLTPELKALQRGLDEADADVVLHDGLSF